MNPLSIPIGLLLCVAGVAFTAPKKGRPVGPCEPYAETCRHCTDCTQCQHCAKDKGWCSVCFKN